MQYLTLLSSCLKHFSDFPLFMLKTKCKTFMVWPFYHSSLLAFCKTTALALNTIYLFPPQDFACVIHSTTEAFFFP